MVCREKRTKWGKDIYETKTWFEWNHCIVCEKEFRREPIFQTYSRHFTSRMGGLLFKKIYSFCKKCCPTKKEAFLAYKKYIPPMPKVKPPKV